MLLDRSVLIGQKIVENAKIKNSNVTFFVIFKHCVIDSVPYVPQNKEMSSECAFSSNPNAKHDDP